MSRAFVKENDGWHHCVKYKEDCMMADEYGKCVLDECRQYPEEKRSKDQEAKNN